MIIQCEKCQTRFRLDDSRVTDKGAKVRCTKCKYVFTVQKKEPAIESSESETALAGFSFPVDQDEAPPASPENQHYAADFSSFDISSPGEPAVSFEADESFGDVSGNIPASAEEPSGEEKEIDFSSFDVPPPEETAVSFETDETYGDVTGNAPASAEEPAGEEKEIDFSSFDISSPEEPAVSFETDDSFGDVTVDIPASAEAPAGEESEVDLSGFGFDEDETIQDSSPLSTTSTDAFTGGEREPVVAEPQKKEVPQGLDFSDDAMFGAVVEADQEPSSDTISFDFGDDSYAESIDTGGQDSGSKSGTSFSFDSHADTPFNLGEIDFGDDLTSVAVQQVNPDDLKPSQEILFAPLAEAKSKSTVDKLTEAFRRETPSGGQEELPPLSIASRRKQSPLYSGMIGLSALLVIMIVGYFGYSSFSSRSDTAIQDTGKIAIRAVTASYVDNDEAGELLVISGEALNEYPQPRAALQVKVTLFDADGQSLVTKSAYGGNPLTEEQLESLPLEKIEAAMANQFGDSLANMEVAPGKAIPFVVVLAKLPKGAKDFDVQSVGSTVATGKQQ